MLKSIGSILSFWLFNYHVLKLLRPEFLRTLDAKQSGLADEKTAV
jgi:hypothetical protein